MKKIFKLLPVALGLIAMASCSNDDFFGEKSADLQEFGGDAANVTVEDLYSTTRSAHTAAKAVKWCDGDQFRIYNADLSKFDTYEFATSTRAFTRKYSTQRVANDDITYAVFPSNQVSYTEYDEATEDVKVVMTIPSTITYNGSSEKDFDGTLAYLSNLPMTGAAEYDATYGANVPLMKYMTGIVMVTLDNVQSKATWLKLSADKPLAGAFVATLGDATVLQEADDDVIAEPKNSIYVNIANAPRSRAIVYLPVIVGTYSSLKVEYTTGLATSTVATVAADDAAALATTPVGVTWTEIKQFATGTPASVTVPRAGSVSGSVLEADYNFQLDTHTPEALSVVLSDRASVTKNLLLNIDYLEFTSIADDAKWYTIKVPNMKADTVRIQMPNGINNNTINRSKLVIADADDSAPYEGTIVFDLTDQATGVISNGTNKLGVEVNLAKANVTLAGDWTNADGGITFTAANNVNLGDGETATKINETPTFTTDVTGKLTIANNATVNNASSSFIAIKGSGITEVDIKGYVGYLNTYNATTVMSGKGQADIIIVEGDTEFDLANEGEAVKNSLTVQAPVTITMKQGYLKKLVLNNSDAFAADTKVVNVKLNNGDEQGNVAFGSIVKSSSFTFASGKNLYNYIKFTESDWNGEPIGASFTATYASDADIYTANELASTPGTQQTTLRVDVNLKDKNWTPIAKSADFDGNGKTIKNLNLTQKTAATSAYTTHTGIGLFSTVTNTVTIKNFTLNGVKWDQPADYIEGTGTTINRFYDNANVGAVVGVASAAATFMGIKVQNATFNATALRDDVNNVGGLIGQATAAVVIGATGAANANNISASITGYYGLGGVIGEYKTATGTITFTNNTVAPTFTVNKTLAANKQSDVNYGKVGDLVGTITADGTSPAPTVNVLTTSGSSNTITSGIAGKKQDLKFHQHKNYYAVSVDETQEQYYFGCMADNNWVGFSASAAILQKDGATQKNRYTATGNSVKVTTGSDRTNFNYFVLSEADVQ